MFCCQSMFVRIATLNIATLLLGFAVMPDDQPRSLPVIPFFEETKHDNPPPKEVLVDDSKTAMRDLKKRFEKVTPKVVPPTIDEIVASPAKLSSRIGLWMKLVDLPQLKVKLLEQLDSDASPVQQRECAVLLTRLRDQRGYDWAFQKLTAGDTDIFPDVDAELNLLVQAAIADKKWVRSDELWKRIAPRLESDSSARNTACYYTLRQYEEWCLEQLENKQTPIERREEYFHTLAYYAPSLRGLKASLDLYATEPDDARHRFRMSTRLTLLERFAECDRNEQLDEASEEEKAELRNLVCDTAERFVRKRPSTAGLFHRCICKYGDKRWEAYFNVKVKSRQSCYHAFEAIVRLQADNREAYLRSFLVDWDERSPLIREQALSMLCTDLAGSLDEELSAWLIDRALNGDKRSRRDKAIRQLFLLGQETQALLLLKREEPTTKEPQPDPEALLADLHAAGFGRDLTMEDVNPKVQSPTEEHPSNFFVSAKNQVRRALDLVGLHDEVDCINEVKDQFKKLAKISGGEFGASLVVVEEENKRVVLRVGDSVLNYFVTYPEELQDPFSLAAIANAILRDAKSPNRFVPHADYEGMSDVWFYFGDQDLATKLETKYDIKFVPGWNKQF